jgi:hypothetical protein
MSKTLLDCVLHLKKENSDDNTQGFDVYWTPHGLLMTNDRTAYFFHYSKIPFVMDMSTTKTNGSPEIGVVMKSLAQIEIRGWELAFCEMLHGVLVRKITEHENVPKISRLKIMGEEMINCINKGGTIQWITC